MEDFDISQNKMAESAQRVVDRAVEESRRREHPLLTNEHIFLAFAQVEWDMFAQVMRDLDLNPHEILQALEEHLRMVPAFSDRDMRVAPATKLLFKLAFHHASRAGRQAIEAADLFAAVFEESQGIPVSIIRRHGVEPELLVSRIATPHARPGAARGAAAEEVRAAALPEALRHEPQPVGPPGQACRPLYGRTEELRQVMEILCHRERANSVMLIGEPGVGKTAIVEGLARRIEFEPESVPVRLRDCQVVNLQMNSMVAGTMLRGMFEDRIQNVIREIKEHPNLILFVDEVHTMIGAGSALGAPSDAANVFKSVLARGEVRMIGATTLSEYKEYIQEDEALARRFRTVHVKEPDLEETRRIMYNLRPRLERNYSVKVLDEAVDTAHRDGAALHAAPPPARQGDRLARHRRGPGRDRPAVGGQGRGRRVGDLGRRRNPRGHGVPGRDGTASRRSRARLGNRLVGQQRRRQRGGPPAGPEQGTAQGRVRPPGRRAALPRPDRASARPSWPRRSPSSCSATSKKMIRVDMSEYQDGMVAVDKLIGMPRGIVGSERGRHPDQPAARQPVHRAVCSTRWRRRAPTCSRCSSRPSTRGG